MTRLNDRLWRIAREPLVHFLLAGAAIFGLYGLVAERADGPPEDRVVVTVAEVDHLVSVWRDRWQREPSPDERRDLILEHLRDVILYREALALGLDRDDPIVRRHLRQKFEFVTQDLAVARAPDRATLAAFYEENRERYRAPETFSFTQVFFNLDRRGAAGAGDAQRTLAILRDAGSETDISDLGDSRMLDNSYREMTLRQVEVQFGRGFAAALERLEPGVWSGPVESGFGLHLLRLDAKGDGQVLPLDEIAERVRADWEYAERQQANEAIFQQLLGRYDLVVEGEDNDAILRAAEGAAQ